MLCVPIDQFDMQDCSCEIVSTVFVTLSLHPSLRKARIREDRIRFLLNYVRFSLVSVCHLSLCGCYDNKQCQKAGA